MADRNGKDFAAFDFNTISDAVLHLKYTAREGGELLKRKAKDALREAIAHADGYPQLRLFSLRHEFPNEWNQLKQGKQVSLVNLKDRLPFFVQGRTLTVENTTLLVRDPDDLTITLNGERIKDWERNPDLSNLLIGHSSNLPALDNVTLSATNTDKLEDLMILIQYTLVISGASGLTQKF